MKKRNVFKAPELRLPRLGPDQHNCPQGWVAGWLVGLQPCQNTAILVRLVASSCREGCDCRSLSNVEGEG